MGAFLNLQETDLGFEVETPQFLFFFGKKPANLKSLQTAYPQFQFLTIHQVHSDQIHFWSTPLPKSPQADGHTTSQVHQALCISTADCVPILLAHPSGLVMGLHAGWKGVANRILPKGFQFLGTSVQERGCFVLVGPHIQQASFEIQMDVRAQLMAASPAVQQEPAVYFSDSPQNPGRLLANLNAMVKAQIAEFDIPSDQVFELHLNTFTDHRFHSYRRDREKAGRQISFVVRKI